MSKKMSLQDMKEVKRLIGMLITNEFKNIYYLRVNSYRSITTHVSENLSSSNMTQYTQDLVDKHNLTKELSELQKSLYAKQTELIKLLTKQDKKSIETELENDGARNDRWRDDDEVKTKYFDDFNAIRKAGESINKILFKRLEERVEDFAEKLNTYINSIENRVFDAYTKGMSADDFLDMIKNEIKDFQTERNEIAEELESNGYNNKND